MSLKWFAKKKNQKIKAIQEENFRDYLHSIGELSKIQDGKLHCKYCHESITVDNIEAIIPDNKGVVYICSKLGCISKISDA